MAKQTIGEKQDIILGQFKRVMESGASNSTVDALLKSSEKRINRAKKYNDEINSKGQFKSGLTVLQYERIMQNREAKAAQKLSGKTYKHSLLEAVKEVLHENFTFENYKELKSLKEDLSFEVLLASGGTLNIDFHRVTKANMIFNVTETTVKEIFAFASETDKTVIKTTKTITTSDTMKIRHDNNNFVKNAIREFDKLIFRYNVVNEFVEEVEDIW